MCENDYDDYATPKWNSIYLIGLFSSVSEQCYTHKNLGWKIIVEDKGAHVANHSSTNIRTNISLSTLFLLTIGIPFLISTKFLKTTFTELSA